MDSRQMLFFLAFIFCGSPAFAQCDISKYDQTPPAAIGDQVNNGDAHFKWSTDVDVIGGRNWVWHYVANSGDKGIGYKWPKAALRHVVGNPLEPGKIDCNKYFVTGPTAPDDNAPITYGTSDTVQRAAVFAETKTSEAQSTGSVVETNYRTPSGVVEPVRVTITSYEGKSDQDRWQIIVDRTSDVAVAISLPRTVSADQYVALSKQLEAAVPVKFNGKDLAKLFSENELASRVDQAYLVMGGGPRKTGAVIPATALQPVSSDLLLLDREKRPFFATTVRLLAPKDAR